MAHTTFHVGRLTCHALEGGVQHLDGGAMFGVVPKPLWERRITPDERNRIRLALRCLLVEHDAGLVLIDTGLGNKEGPKFKDIYGVANEGAGRTAAPGSRTRCASWDTGPGTCAGSSTPISTSITRAATRTGTALARDRKSVV